MSSDTAPPESEPVRVCEECGADISDRHGSARYCGTCAKARQRAKDRAYQAQPEIKERRRRRNATNLEHRREVARAYGQRPEVRERIRAKEAEYRSRPEVRERRRKWDAAYRARPEVKARKAAARARTARERAARRKAEAVAAARAVVAAADAATDELEPVQLPPLGSPRSCRFCGTGIEGKPRNVVFCCAECRKEWWLRSEPGRERRRNAMRLWRARQIVQEAERQAQQAETAEPGEA